MCWPSSDVIVYPDSGDAERRWRRWGLSVVILLKAIPAVVGRWGQVEPLLEEATPTSRSDPISATSTGALTANWLAWSLWGLCVLLIAASLLLDFLTPDFLAPPERPGLFLSGMLALLALACPTVGALVASRLPGNPVGWIFCGMGLLYGVRHFARAYADHALLAWHWLPLGAEAAWISTWLRYSWLIMLTALLVLVFPGWLLSRRWRPAVWLAIAGAAMLTLGDAFRSGPLFAYYYVHNPFGFAGNVGGVLPAYQLFEVASVAGGVLLSASCLASVVALILRLHRTRGWERRRLRWFAYAAIPAMISSTVFLLDWTVERFALLVMGRTVLPLFRVAQDLVLMPENKTAGRMGELQVDAVFEVLTEAAILLVSLCTGVAILKYGLYDVGPAANRALRRLWTVLSGLRWAWILLAGAVVGLMPYAFIYLAIYAYVVFYPLFRPGQASGEQLAGVVALVSGLGTRAFFLATTAFAAWWVARKVGNRAALHGMLVGLIAVIFNQVIMFLRPSVTLDELPIYLTLGLAGGWLGGAAGHAALPGGVYRASQQIGRADDPDALAEAIGEHLGGTGLHSVVLWLTTSEDEGSGGSTGTRAAQEFAHWASWAPRGEDIWPPGARLNATAAPALASLRERPSTVQRAVTLPAAERALWEQRGIRTTLLIPLIAPGGTWIGLLMVAFRERRRFSRRLVRAYLTVATQAALALENMRLVEEARQAGILVERQRLAREIHDTLAQGFTSIIMSLTAAQMAQPGTPRAASARHLEEALRTARESLAEARRLVWALRPESLDRHSLSEALGRLTKDWSEETGVEARAVATGTPRPLLPEVEVALLRAAQEALTNVRKHARAAKVNVTLSYLDDRVVLDVLDDGVGFDPAQLEGRAGAHDTGGFGLVAMRERVELLGGRLLVESTPGEGTTIVIELPIIANEPEPRESRSLREMR
jgi:signal transduction histidine kinase